MPYAKNDVNIFPDNISCKMGLIKSVSFTDNKVVGLTRALTENLEKCRFSVKVTHAVDLIRLLNS